MTEEESLLTNLCAICHLQPPKYRCPRCSARTCSLPCTKRHKLWSQCSGVRDPGAYVRRSDLATESAFDRDFNFITGIERHLERAGRDAEERGVDTDLGKRGIRDPGSVGLDGEADVSGSGMEGGRGKGKGKRKRGPGFGFENGLVKGEVGFLRRAQEAGVKVIKAPRGMSREKANESRWFPKSKTLQWTVEFVIEDGNAPRRVNVTEDVTIAQAYDRAFPLTKEERQVRDQTQTQTQQPTPTTQEAETKETSNQGPAASQSLQAQAGQEPGPDHAAKPDTSSTTAAQSTAAIPTRTQQNPIPTYSPDNKAVPTSPSTIPAPYRTMTFYIHRPRTGTKQPVLSPVAATSTLASALIGRVVLEFPTIYALRSPLINTDVQSETPEEKPEPASEPKYILESTYLRTHPGGKSDSNTAGGVGAEGDGEGSEDQDTDSAPAFGEVDIPDVDEGKMMEVLKKDLLG
ncbi:uncharacterized protein BDV17DRAFT_283801 [Aspergillus undulatus]|uniref:uncharacterized protein n=1 Tax=Aspergillus undulatus TaxID=1810928 RepID=UPI003CCE4050